MDIILVRHGKAQHPAIDPEKGLSPKGETEVKSVAKRIKQRLEKSQGKLGRIIHSDKKRAKDTAELIAAILDDDTPVEEHLNLAPEDPVDPILNEIVHERESILIVSHLPFLPHLMEKLGAHAIEFGTATAVSINRDTRTINWIELPN